MVLLSQINRQLIKHPGFRKWVFERSGYNKFGFYHDDLEVMGHFPEHPPTEPVYKEALRRLPADEYDRYCFRVIRASQLEINKAFVESPPTFEEDETKGRFLTPYVKEILSEKKEKEDWNDFLSQK